MKKVGLAFVGLTLSAAVNLAAPALKGPKIDDATRILGQWNVDSLSTRGGESQPQSNVSIRFSKDGTCGITNGGREIAALYSLDPSQEPRRMKWLNGPEKTEWLCLYEFDGEVLKVAFVDRGSDPPRKVEPGNGLTIYYLRRMKE
jgi:uncharacterized protein (TIGR03067 family)